MRKQAKAPFSFRLDPELVAAVRAHGGELTAAVETGLRLWLRQLAEEQARRAATADSLPVRRPPSVRDFWFRTPPVAD